MGIATRGGGPSAELHVADSHELIRVVGARVNNLKDVSIEIPKRRLTVFTGVSGSGKSSLVFGAPGRVRPPLSRRAFDPNVRPGSKCR